MTRQSLGFALVCALLLTGAADARAYRPQQDLTLSLGVSHDETDFRYEDNGATPDSRYSRLVLELWNHELPGIDIGLTGGAGRFSQDDAAATEGQATTGRFFGLLGGAGWALGEYWGLELRGEWVYHSLSGEDLDYEWFNAHARAGLYLRIGRWRLSGGTTAGLVRGERRLPGQTRDFDAEHNAGAYLRAGMDVGRGGEISLRAEAGLRHALMLRFTRAFQ